MIIKQPKDAVALHSRGYCNLQLRHYELALKDINSAISLNPANGDLYLLRALANQGLNNTTQTQSDLAKAKVLGSVSLANSRTSSDSGSTAAAAYRPTGKFLGAHVRTDDREFAWQYETKHLMVYSDSERTIVQGQAEALEGFITYIDSHLWRVKGVYPVKVLSFKTDKDMSAFLRGRNETRQLYGQYVSERNEFITYEDSGFGTWTHEMMHKVLDDKSLCLDGWSKEGIPTIFEKTYGYWSPSGWQFVWGYENPWRLKGLSSSWDQLRLSTIVNTASRGSVDESKERLVAMFMVRQKLLERYLSLAATGNKGGYGSIIESTFHKQLEELDPLFECYLQNIKAHWNECINTPNSTYFFSKAEFDQFVKENATVLQMSAGR